MHPLVAPARISFPVLGPVGVVAVRQYVAAIVLITVGRPRLRTFTWQQWRPVLLLALVFGTMNLSLYSAIDRTQGSAAAAGLSALMFLPVGLVIVVQHPPTAGAAAYSVAAGVLSSAVPYLADLFTLRRVQAHAFGLFMSVNPILAAVAGWIILGQNLGWIEWAGVGAIVAANALSILTSRT
ncbi:EamA family transporter [Actinacidiphila oryziradicis]|uniref:EamA domain-containing protein n=1 Tax=Actinacidiphila oryziradicis TaxID=2571141 RepID=A0A4V5N020_9ACTN|nr:EamA family transporter [Actinacidiphila oryziradicis]TKA10299.1 hypothetical protein FCI23_17785 [Actinacidiphila oryziradicis]